MASPSELFDWQVRYLDIYLVCVYAGTTLALATLVASSPT